MVEDLKRKRVDRDENESKVYKANIDVGKFEETLWQDIKVGDIV
jgi:hypothetical protein